MSLDSGVGKLKRENHLSRQGDGAGAEGPWLGAHRTSLSSADARGVGVGFFTFGLELGLGLKDSAHFGAEFGRAALLSSVRPAPAGDLGNWQIQHIRPSEKSSFESC